MATTEVFERMMKVAEVRRTLGTSLGWVYSAIETGMIRSVRVGRSIRVPESALREYIERGGQRRPAAA